MKKKLNQILAIEKGIKTKSYSAIAALHQATQKAELLNGFVKEYQPLIEDGQRMPPQSQKVQFNARDVFDEAKKTLAELFDVTASKDWGNQSAKADLEVDGQVLLTGVPATYLLFLEKKLDELRVFVEKFAELDPAVEWDHDQTTGLFKSQPTATVRTEKKQKALVLYQATDKHPAQTQLVTEDITVGTWTTIRFSGALPAPQKKAILARIEKLYRSVKQALESANMADVEMQQTGEKVLGYIFG